MKENGNRPSPESFLAKLNKGEQAKLRVYIGAAPGVGKTYQMLEDAHLLKKQRADIINRFLDEVRDATVQVVPLEQPINGRSAREEMNTE